MLLKIFINCFFWVISYKLNIIPVYLFFSNLKKSIISKPMKKNKEKEMELNVSGMVNNKKILTLRALWDYF